MNAEIHHLYEAIAATATVGIGLSITTFGVSDAAAAVMASDAETIRASIIEFLGEMTTTVAGYAADFAAQWAKVFAMVLAVDETSKIVQGKPLDWHLSDLTTAINYTTAITAVPGDLVTANPFAAGALMGGGGSALNTAVTTGNFDLQSLETIGVSALAGSILNTAASQLFPMTPEETPDSNPAPPRWGRSGQSRRGRRRSHRRRNRSQWRSHPGT